MLGHEPLKNPRIGGLNLGKSPGAWLSPGTAKGKSAKVSGIVRVLVLCA